MIAVGKRVMVVYPTLSEEGDKHTSLFQHCVGMVVENGLNALVKIRLEEPIQKVGEAPQWEYFYEQADFLAEVKEDGHQDERETDADAAVERLPG